jgi:hypothetical protein
VCDLDDEVLRRARLVSLFQFLVELAPLLLRPAELFDRGREIEEVDRNDRCTGAEVGVTDQRVELPAGLDQTFVNELEPLPLAGRVAGAVVVAQKVSLSVSTPSRAVGKRYRTGSSVHRGPARAQAHIAQVDWINDQKVVGSHQKAGARLEPAPRGTPVSCRNARRRGHQQDARGRP